MKGINYDEEYAKLCIYPDNEMTINQRIKKQRYKKGETQETFAEKADINLSSLKKYEDKTYPSIEVIEKIAKYCKVTSNYLIDGEITINELNLDAEYYLRQIQLNNDRIALTVFVYLFQNGMIQQLIDLVIGNLEYECARNVVSEYDERLSESIKHQLDYLTWKGSSELSEIIAKSTQSIFKLLPDEFKNNKDIMKSQENSDKMIDASDVLDYLENVVDCFQKYRNTNEDGE